MELIKEILEKDVVKKDIKGQRIEYSLRKAARAILFKDNKVALLFVSKNNYHKLPGGGIEQGETIEEALSREILEETGYTNKIQARIGITIEYKDKVGILQISYIFLAEILKESKKINLTEKEKAQGFILEWHTLDEVKKLFSKDDPKDYDGKFISLRDSSIITYLTKSKDS